MNKVKVVVNMVVACAIFLALPVLASAGIATDKATLRGQTYEPTSAEPVRGAKAMIGIDRLRPYSNIKICGEPGSSRNQRPLSTDANKSADDKKKATPEDIVSDFARLFMLLAPQGPAYDQMAQFNNAKQFTEKETELMLTEVSKILKKYGFIQGQDKLSHTVDVAYLQFPAPDKVSFELSRDREMLHFEPEDKFPRVKFNKGKVFLDLATLAVTFEENSEFLVDGVLYICAPRETREGSQDTSARRLSLPQEAQKAAPSGVKHINESRGTITTEIK